MTLTCCVSAFSIQGVDVYHGSRHVDYSTLKGSGHGGFVYIKATEGEHTPDTFFPENVRGARSVNMPYGAYHYFHPYSVNSAVRQADFFWKKIRDSGYQLYPSVDVESYDGQNRSEDIRKMLRAFITEFQRLSGYKPVIYTYTDYAKNVLGNYFIDCKLWLADYRGYAGLVPGWGHNYSIWQYSGDKARVRGVDNPCDLDVAVDKNIFLIPSAKNPIPVSRPVKATPYPGKRYFGQGKQNKYILMLDKALISHGYAKYYKKGKYGASTGWGNGTRRACAAFQRSQGWRGSGSDGVPGPQTWAGLGL